MTDSAVTTDEYQHLIRLVRLGRQLEMAGHYNAAKLFWAAAFSEEIRASNEGVHVTLDVLKSELAGAVDALVQRGVSPSLQTALITAQQLVDVDRTIRFEAIPGVHVCRACGEIAVGTQPERCPSCGGFELTFRSFLPVHYLDPLPPAIALEALASVPVIIEGMIAGLTDDDLELAPAEGEWCICEVLGHLVGSQELIADRVKRMLDQDNPSLKALGPTELSQGVVPGTDLFRQFKASRIEMVDRLRSIGDNDWWRTGMHEEFGKVTLLQQASYFAKHDHAHLTQIEQIRRATQKDA